MTRTSARLSLLVAVTLVGFAPTVSAAAPGDVGWPVADPRVTSGFRPPPDPWAPGHRGIDLAAAPGEPVLAMTDGRVAFAGIVAGKPVIVLTLDDGRRLTFEPVVALVPQGTSVSAGDRIGTVSAHGGHCGGACVHVGLRSGRTYLDPMTLLGRRPAVLKPV